MLCRAMKTVLAGLCLIIGVLMGLHFEGAVAHAHKVHIFAYVEGGQVKTESKFNGGRPARNCEVEVQATRGGKLVQQGTTNEEGFFAFPAPESMGDLDIVISCGDGHRGSWRLEAEEYAVSVGVTEGLDHRHPLPEEPAAQPAIGGGESEMLRAIVAAELDRQLAPLRRDIARLQERKTSLQDILGGIGYLLGLAGLAAYFKYKKS